MQRSKVFVLYEHSQDLRPHGSAALRLLRPLSHPTLREKIEMLSGPDYLGQPVQVVIVDRLWKPWVTQEMIERLINDVRQAQAKLIYSLDDSFFDIPSAHINKPTPEALQVVDTLLRQADAVIVPSKILRKRLKKFNPNIFLLPQALDERLLALRTPPSYRHPYRKRRKVIGTMGTWTHDDDLMLVLPALKSLYQKLHNDVEFQFIGVVGKPETKELLKGLPVRYLTTGPGEEEYQLFMPWYTAQTDWDIAIAPLKNTAFNRAKSDIKFLDYCAIGAAGIYSPIPAYKESVHDLETGWLADNRPQTWLEALETLINDDDLRLKIARNGYTYLHSQRTLAQCAYRWWETLNTIIDYA